MIIDVRCDSASIETAALELLEEGLASEYRRRLGIKLGASADRALDEYDVERTLAPGFYEWACHLLEMDHLRNLGAMPNVSAREVYGLVAVNRARGRFGEIHPFCPHCGISLLDRLVRACQICGGKLERKAA